jgi:hypothetical protein
MNVLVLTDEGCNLGGICDECTIEHKCILEWDSRRYPNIRTDIFRAKARALIEEGLSMDEVAKEMLLPVSVVESVLCQKT